MDEKGNESRKIKESPDRRGSVEPVLGGEPFEWVSGHQRHDAQVEKKAEDGSGGPEHLGTETAVWVFPPLTEGMDCKGDNHQDSGRPTDWKEKRCDACNGVLLPLKSPKEQSDQEQEERFRVGKAQEEGPGKGEEQEESETTHAIAHAATDHRAEQEAREESEEIGQHDACQMRIAEKERGHSSEGEGPERVEGGGLGARFVASIGDPKIVLRVPGLEVGSEVGLLCVRGPVGVFTPALHIKDVRQQEDAGEHKKEQPSPPREQGSDEGADALVAKIWSLGVLLQEL